MRKLILAIGIFLGSLSLFAQGTIVDYPNEIKFQFSNGDTVSIYKSNIGEISVNGERTEVVIYSDSQYDFNTGVFSIIRKIDPDDFGYSSVYVLREFLATIANGGRYDEKFTRTGGLTDTIFHCDPVSGDTLWYYLFNYTSDTLSRQRTIVW